VFGGVLSDEASVKDRKKEKRNKQRNKQTKKGRKEGRKEERNKETKKEDRWTRRPPNYDASLIASTQPETSAMRTKPGSFNGDNESPHRIFAAALTKDSAVPELHRELKS